MREWATGTWTRSSPGATCFPSTLPRGLKLRARHAPIRMRGARTRSTTSCQIGMGDRYLDSIKPWRDLLPQHFTTWPETPGETRSDSHAWSAHPIYDLLSDRNGRQVPGLDQALARLASPALYHVA